MKTVTNNEAVHTVLWEAEIPLTLTEIAERLGSAHDGPNWPAVRSMLRQTLYRLEQEGRAAPDKTGRGGPEPQRWTAA